MSQTTKLIKERKNLCMSKLNNFTCGVPNEISDDSLITEYIRICKEMKNRNLADKEVCISCLELFKTGNFKKCQSCKTPFCYDCQYYMLFKNVIKRVDKNGMPKFTSRCCFCMSDEYDNLDDWKLLNRWDDFINVFCNDNLKEIIIAETLKVRRDPAIFKIQDMTLYWGNSFNLSRNNKLSFSEVPYENRKEILTKDTLKVKKYLNLDEDCKVIYKMYSYSHIGEILIGTGDNISI